MKNIKYIATVILLAQCASCQQIEEKNYEMRAEAFDESNKPIPNVKVFTGKLELVKESPIPTANPVLLEPVPTNSNGIALLRFKSVPTPAGNVNFYKDGYYSSHHRITWTSPEGFEGTDQSAEVKAILKPIKNPIPMIFHPSAGLHLREIGREYALDLELGEMLPPYGNGKVPDLLVTLEGQRIDNGPDNEEDIDFKARIRFSNPLDGFSEFEVQPKDGAKGSALVSDYLAPENGYQSSLERISVQGKFLTPEGNAPYLSNLKRKAYYFRLRTKTDESGNIISSNYGKIYGPISLHAGRKQKVFHPQILEAGLSITDVYFNQIINDRNVECDTSKNLSKKIDEYGKPIKVDRP